MILYAVSTSTGKPEAITSTAGVLNLNRNTTGIASNLLLAGINYGISKATGLPEPITSNNGSLNTN